MKQQQLATEQIASRDPETELTRALRNSSGHHIQARHHLIVIAGQQFKGLEDRALDALGQVFVAEDSGVRLAQPAADLHVGHQASIRADIFYSEASVQHKRQTSERQSRLCCRLNPVNPMSLDTSIPCFPELDDWPFAPTHPVRIAAHGRYRDSGPQGSTYYVDLKDFDDRCIPFFFERFLGRLCYGSLYETGEDAAFLRRGSRIEQEAILLIEYLATKSPQYEELLEKIRHAKVWTAGT